MGVGAFRQTSARFQRGRESGEAKIGNRNVPDETFLVLYLKLFPNWCQNIEYGKRAGDVEEQGSKSEISARTNPMIERVAASENSYHQVMVLARTFCLTQISSFQDRQWSH